MASYGYYIEKQNWTHWPKALIMRHRTGLDPDETKRYVPERTTTRNGKSKTRYGNRVPLCECCGYAIGDSRYNFCPKCGARIV